jgi:hypothetical protein
MSFDGPCSDPRSLDLENADDQRTILGRDKHTRIEGICVEHLFRRQLITPAFSRNSSGFWFTRKDGRYRVVKLLADPRHFNALDEEVLGHLQRHGVAAWVVYHDPESRGFKVTRFHDGRMDDLLISARNYPRSLATGSISAARERNAERHDKAFALLEEYGVLREAAIERFFASCWIGDAWFWDIDQFVRYKGALVAFEVKQKYPTAAGTFGLNTGLVRLFSMLHALRIHVIHVVLTKPAKSLSIPALDLITQPQHRIHARWLACHFTPAVLTDRTAEAPAFTSIHGGSRLKYHHLSMDSFTDVGGIDAGPEQLVAYLEQVVAKSAIAEKRS